MFKFPELNRHMIAIPSLALAIVGVAVAGNIWFERNARNLSEIDSARTTQSWVNPADQQAANPDSNTNFLAELRRVPPNAYGSAQPEPIQRNTQSGASAVAPSLKQADKTGPTEAKNWTEEEWRLATAAVNAYRKTGKVVKGLSPSALSDLIWQPPAEIADQTSGASR
ncbi:hypothetical protein [Methylocystis echinoides]|uniref:hypothetical protein n=1 Tax=Methylocystis echinoides TaxID=29468 RepID=UPI003427E090